MEQRLLCAAIVVGALWVGWVSLVGTLRLINEAALYVMVFAQ